MRFCYSEPSCTCQLVQVNAYNIYTNSSNSFKKRGLFFKKKGFSESNEMFCPV